MEMQKIIMVVLVVLLATTGGALFNAGGAHFNSRGKHPKRFFRLMNACNLASCNWSCEDAEMQKIIMVVLVVLLAAAGGALFNAGGAHFNAGGKHPKKCVRMMNAFNLARCNRSCEDTGGCFAYLEMCVVAGRR
nr:hypothetical protein [Tanacetum cinerariifolium]